MHDRLMDTRTSVATCSHKLRKGISPSDGWCASQGVIRYFAVMGVEQVAGSNGAASGCRVVAT